MSNYTAATNPYTWYMEQADHLIPHFTSQIWLYSSVISVRFEEICDKVVMKLCGHRGCLYNDNVRLILVRDRQTNRPYIHVYAKTKHDHQECKTALFVEMLAAMPSKEYTF